MLRNPALLILVLLPLIMSMLIISVMDDSSTEIMLLSSWILFAQVMVGIMLTGPNLIEEKEAKTIDALLTTPLNYAHVLIGKGLTVLIFSLISQLLVLLINNGSTENFFALLLSMIIGGIFFIEIGLIIGLHVKSSKTGTAISSVIFVVLYLIGSLYAVFPEWYYLLKFIPSVEITEVMQGIFEGEFFFFESILFIVWIILATMLLRVIVLRMKKE